MHTHAVARLSGAPKMFRSPQAEANRVRTSPHILHLCVGFSFFILYPAASVLPPSRLFHHPLFDITFTHTIFHTQLPHTTLSHTHHLSHTILSHTIFHTQLSHIPSFTHNFITYHLSHITLSQTIFQTQLCHTQSFTHNFVTHTHQLSHNFVTRHVHTHTILSHTHQLSHTTLSYAMFTHTTLSHTCSEISYRITDVECIERAQTIP